MQSIHRRAAQIIACIIFLFGVFDVFGVERNCHFWCSASVFWGQGSVGLAYDLSKNNSLILSQSFVANNYNLDHAQTKFCLSYRLVNKQRLIGGLRYRLNEIEAKEWQEEISPYVGYKHGFPKLSLVSFNHELEHRFRKGNHNYWRLRDRIKVCWLRSYTEYKIRPYVANILFTKLLSGVEFEKNRFYLGISFLFVEHLDIDLYYVYASGETEQEWDDRKSFGASMIYSF